jgi:hypothetical protein
VEITLLVEGFKTNDDLCKHLCGLVEGEHLVLEFGLIVDQIAAVAVLEHQVDVVVVLLDVVELDDVGRVHGLHALDLSI